MQGGASGGITFYGNIGYGNYGDCLWIGGNSTGTAWYNNTCYNNELTNNNAELVINSGATGNTVENNIFYATSGNNLILEQPGASNNTLDYNIYCNGGPTPFSWARTSNNFANYQSMSGQDAHSLQADPLFSNASGNNFTLTSGSPAIDAGTNLGSSYEYSLSPLSVWPTNVMLLNQNSYGAGWDIGAYIWIGH